jgi:hypothetical protein
MTRDHHAVYTKTAALCTALKKLQSDAAATPEEKGGRYREYSGELAKLAHTVQALKLSKSADLSVIASPTSHAHLATRIKVVREMMEIMQAENV